MKYRLFVPALAAFTLASAAESNEALRKELDAYKTETDARIQALENRRSDAGETLPDRATLDFEFHGYFRAGLGTNGDGDPMESFMAPNANSKYRLGNEAETYIEATFQQNYRTEALIEDHVDIYTRLTFAYFTPTVDNNAFDTTTSLREAYAGARGVLETKKEAMFWAGNRFYEHHDIHINDFFFRDMAGFGGGIEDVTIGDNMKWALAWLGGSIDQLDSSGTAYVNDYHFNKNTLDLRLYDIPTGIGTLALSFDVADFAGDVLNDGTTSAVIEDSVGWAAGAILKSDLTATAANRFTLQYGEGAADNFRAVITPPQGVIVTNFTRIATDDTQRLRITDDVTIDLGSPFSLQTVAVYERYDNGFDTGNIIDWVSLGARPVYHFNDYFSLALEGGADYTNQKDGREGVLGKFTIAPQIQPESRHLSRPSIRAFFTYAAWSDGFEGSVAPAGYGTDTQGISVGVQMESWW